MEMQRSIYNSGSVGHTEEVNEPYGIYGITEMQEKRLMVSMEIKDIINTQILKEENRLPIRKSNQRESEYIFPNE